MAGLRFKLRRFARGGGAGAGAEIKVIDFSGNGVGRVQNG